jgi:hypothetical protein
MRIGVIVVGIVVLCVMGFGLRGFFANPDVHLGLRVAVGAIGGGVLWLVIKMIRTKPQEIKKEEPKETDE